MVAWKNLHHLFFCRGCRQWYRMDGVRLVPLPHAPPAPPLDLSVRTGFSEWREDRFRPLRRGAWAPRAIRRLSTRHRRFWLTAISLLLACSMAGVWLVHRTATCAAHNDAPLPEKLEDRVLLWREAWTAGNVAQMLRLTEPSRDRQLRRWLSWHRAPLPSTVELRMGEARTSLTVEVAAIAMPGPDLAEVTLQLRPAESGATQLFAIHQFWTRTSGGWCFFPEVPASARR
jgi:hypothetical protein